MKHQMMKKLALAILVIGGVTVTATASAACIEGCLPTPTYGWNSADVGAWGNHFGSAEAMGDKARAYQGGESNGKVEISVEGDGCGTSCQALKFKAKADAMGQAGSFSMSERMNGTPAIATGWSSTDVAGGVRFPVRGYRW